MSNEPADQQGNVQQDQIAHPESQAQWSLVAEGITLRARITALETENAALREAVIKHGAHTDNCIRVKSFGSWPCDCCGWDSLAAELFSRLSSTGGDAS